MLELFCDGRILESYPSEIHDRWLFEMPALLMSHIRTDGLDVEVAVSIILADVNGAAVHNQITVHFSDFTLNFCLSPSSIGENWVSYCMRSC